MQKDFNRRQRSKRSSEPTFIFFVSFCSMIRLTGAVRLAGVQRMLKFRGLLFFLGGVDFSAFNSLAQYPLERCQDLIAPVRLLVMLLIIVEPECGVNSDKNENQFCRPADETSAEGLSLIFHRPILFAALQRSRNRLYSLLQQNRCQSSAVSMSTFPSGNGNSAT